MKVQWKSFTIMYYLHVRTEDFLRLARLKYFTPEYLFLIELYSLIKCIKLNQLFNDQFSYSLQII